MILREHPIQVVVTLGAAAAAAFVAYAQFALRSELKAQERELENALAANRELSEQLRVCGDHSSPASCDCPAPVACPEVSPLVVTLKGDELGPEEREAYVRAHLEERLTQAFLAGQLSEDQRHGALMLLMRIRSLRASGASGDEFVRAQQELVDLTGMGVGELLEELELSASRSHRPDAVPPIREGELRKRFADETSRRLGIAEPGSVERYEDGVWRGEE